MSETIPPTTRLPVSDVVRDTYAFVWANWRRVLVLAIPGVVVMSAGSAAVLWGIFEIEDMLMGVSGDWVRRGLLLLIVCVVIAVFVGIFVLFSVAMHRMYLLPRKSTTVAASYCWRKRHSWYLLNCVQVIGSTFLVAFFALVSSEIFANLLLSRGFSRLFVPAVVVVAGILTFARLSLLFPANAADRRMKFLDGMDLAKGNSWRLAWILFVSNAPFTAVNLLERGFITDHATDAAVTGSFVLSLSLFMLDYAVDFASIAVGVTALSISYKRLTGT